MAGTRTARARLPVFQDNDVVAGRYRIVRFLAQGGMGEVYEAEDIELRQHLALKTISARAGGSDPNAVERFKREIALARSVTHPNVCRIFDLGQHLPSPTPPATPSPAAAIADNPAAAGNTAPPPAPPAVTFLTMELLAGETLSDFLKRRGRLPVAEALPIVEQMAAALGAAHQAHVVHRDFKSENVFLVPQESAGVRSKRVVVTDFGVARGADGDPFAAQVTGAGIVGTPAYMSPEQVEGGIITSTTDIYALGIVIYEIVTGRLPFEGSNPLTTAVKRLREPPPPPHVHVPDLEAWWEKAILRCLERDPANRFVSTEAVAAALQPPAAGRPQDLEAKQPSQNPRQRRASDAAGPATQRSPQTVSTPPHRPELPRPGPPTGADSPRRSLALGLLLLLVSVISAGLFLFNRDRELDRSRVTPRRSIAVLGFTNLSGDSDAAWMGTALAEMLTTELARGEALRTLPGEQVAQARQQLELDASTSLAKDDLERVRSILSCDFLVSGSYVTLGDGANDVRLDLRLQDAALGTTVASLARDGQKAELFAMVADLGSELREHLGVDEAGGKDDPLAGLPQQPDAARLYAEALDKLRSSQAREARELLEQASRLAPQNALVYSALSQAWESEGYGQRAAEAAKRAFEHSSSLPREDRLAVEGRFREATADWPGAIEVYRKLSDYFPDDLDYGLRLAAAQTSNRESENALRTLEDLRRLPAPISEDPRIDLAEASAAGLASDFNRQLAAARRASERAEAVNAGVLVAQARLAESQAHRLLGQLTEAEGAARHAYELYGNLNHPSGTTQALTAMANLDFDRGRFDQAAERYQQVIADYRRIGDQDGTASGLNNLAMVLKKRGDLDSAQQLYEESAKIFEATGDTLAMTFSLNNLGVLLVARDRLADAGEMFERSREVWQQLGNRSGLAYSLNNIAAVHRLRGDLATSRSVHEEALVIRQETGEKSGEATSLTNLAEVLGDLGEISEADTFLSRALELAGDIGDRSAHAQTLHVLGNLRLASGKLDQALAAHEQALELRTALAETHRITDSQIALAEVALESGDLATAESESQMAVLACQKQERRAAEAHATALLARALLALERRDVSRAAAEGATRLAEASEQLAIKLEVGIVAARVAAAFGEVNHALEALEEIERRSQQSGYVGPRLEAMLAWAEIGRGAGYSEQAQQRLQTVKTEAASRGLGLLAQRASQQ